MPKPRLLPILALWLLVATACAQTPPVVKLELLRTFPMPGGVVFAAAFAPDGATLATGGELGDLILWDVPKRTPRWRRQQSDHWLGAIEFSPDGRLLAAKGRDLTLHDAATGTVLWRQSDTGPHGLGWRADGAQLAFARDCEVIVIDAVRREVVSKREFEYPIKTLCFTKDGKDLFVGDNVARVWRLPVGSGEPELLTDQRGTGVAGMASTLFVAWAGDERFELTSSGSLRRGTASFAVPGNAFAAAVAPGGRSFAVGGGAEKVRWWTEAGAQHHDLLVPGHVAALAFHPDGRTLFVSTYRGEQALHLQGTPPAPFPGHDGRVRDCVLSPDGEVVALRGDEARPVRLQPLAGGPARVLPGVFEIAATWQGHEFLVRKGRRIAVVDGLTGAEVVGLEREPSFMSDLAAGPGRTVLDAGELVDLTSGAVVKLPDGVLGTRVCDVARAPDGSWALGVVGGIEGDSGTLVVTGAAGVVRFLEDLGPVATVAFSPDGSQLVYSVCESDFFGGTHRNRVRVRDATTFALLREMPAQVRWWRFLDARYGLSLGNEGLQVWDTQSWQVVQKLSVAANGGICLSADRKLLVVANGGTVQAFRVVR